MKLFTALGCSALLHVGWILLWPLLFNVNAKVNDPNIQMRPLILHLNNESGMTFLPKISTAISAPAKKIEISTKVDHQKLTKTHTILHQDHSTATDQNVEMTYLSTKEVDIQAIPINNINASMLPTSMQNTQVKLRLFIDEFGHVARIEPIKSQLYQNEYLETALSELLAKVSFTPAKRNGSDVKSYQDIAYDFNFYQANSPSLNQ